MTKQVYRTAQGKVIDMGSLANGLYIIRLYNANGDLVKLEKLVKSGN